MSDLRISGMPCLEKMASSFWIVPFTDVVVRISTSGYRLYSSIMTSRYSPVGNGPTKSTATLVHAFSGSGDGCRDSGGGNVPWV